MEITNEKQPDKKFCAVTPPATMPAPVRGPAPQNKQLRKSRGWIRGFPTNGKMYYYYCTSIYNGPDDYREKKEYLGTAERIHAAVVMTRANPADYVREKK
jgi:hypothetical protein